MIDVRAGLKVWIASPDGLICTGIAQGSGHELPADWAMHQEVSGAHKHMLLPLCKLNKACYLAIAECQ